MSKYCENCNPINEPDLPIIVLPCGYSICYDEIIDLPDNFDCMFCSNHIIDKYECFNMQRNKSTLREIENKNHETNSSNFKSPVLNKNKDELDYFVNEHISSILRKIDQKREELKLKLNHQIDEYSNELVLELKNYGKEYKKIHLKCCKFKKDTLEKKKQDDSALNKKASVSSSVLNNQTPSSLSATINDPLNPMSQLFQTLTESCIFCSKPLGNLNSFNRKMHIENCKIRKNLESNLQAANSDGTKVEVVQDPDEKADNCVYCNKSFVKLKTFHRRLHLDHCKLKKRKLKELNNQEINLETQEEPIVSQEISEINSNLDNEYIDQGHNEHVSSQNEKAQMSLDTPELCMYCSRSLDNLSTFNKNLHTDRCKIKQLKKAEAEQSKQANRNTRKRAKTSNNYDINENNQNIQYSETQYDLTAKADFDSSENLNDDLTIATIANNSTDYSNHLIETSPQVSHEYDSINSYDNHIFKDEKNEYI
ncbi:unnamed protein product [Brachionus calyciflorus]|uniref:Uncharacterized protein n=1 Tax=Brachionus calyciflorus TaxID=104777 RepID=A0A813PNC5_9BILA|nr:unnamed protein product [Brachionus calyciflorus]